MTAFYDKVAALCADAGLAISHFVEKELGLQRSTATSWGRGSKPNRATLLKIMAFFGVSEEYLTDDTIPVKHGKGKAAGLTDSTAVNEKVNEEPGMAPSTIAPTSVEERLWVALDIINVLSKNNATLTNTNAKLSHEIVELKLKIEEKTKTPPKNNSMAVATTRGLVGIGVK